MTNPDTYSNSNRKSPPKKSWKRWLLQIFLWSLLLAVAGGLFSGGAALGFFASLVKEDTVRNEQEIRQRILENAETGFAYFSGNTLIGQLRADEDRRIVQLNEIPQDLINGFMAIEDDKFDEHPGINIKALVRATLQQATGSEVQTGGSTITQQLAKIAFFSFEKTYKRKAKEILLALRMERILSKEEILTAYLNKIPFGKAANGNNVYGVQAAAKGIFGVDVNNLNLSQAAYLAGIPQRPFAYTAFSNDGFSEKTFNEGIERQHRVLARMLELGHINQDEYDNAIAFDLKASLTQPTLRAYNRYPFLMLEIEERAAKILLEQQDPKWADERGTEEYYEAVESARLQLLHKGYKVFTTIDKDIYEAMQVVAQNPENFTKYEARNALEQVGATLIDNKTGAILGMIEGRDFSEEQFNHTTAPRQPGSAMKPLAAYAPALELGYTQPSDAIDDVPIILADGQKGEHIPVNWDAKYHGLITAREALRWSYNIPAIKLYQQVTIDRALDYVKKMGITTLEKSDYHAQTGVIGGLAYGTTVEEITNAYATFGNNGTFIDAYLIERIETIDGETIFQHEIKPQVVFSDRASFLMTDMLRTVVQSGTGTTVKQSLKNNKIDYVGKTGTTSDEKDLWFIGYTPDVSLGVWIGYDQPQKLVESKRAKYVWAKVLDAVLDIKPEVSPKENQFRRPQGLVKMQVCSKSGLLPTDLCREADTLVTDWFDKQWIPTEEDNVHHKGRVVVTGDKQYLAQEVTPADMVVERIGIVRPEPYPIVTSTKDVPRGKDPKTFYKPIDASLELPTETDPRSDNGMAPAAPRDLTAVQKENKVTLKWRPNIENDVVGYRLYRSINGGPFEKISSVLQHQPKEHVDQILPDSFYIYQITAVDVVGKESFNSDPVIVNDHLYGSPEEYDNVEEPKEPNQPKDPASPTLVPHTPVGVTATNDGISVNLQWTANPPKDKVQSYNIYYSDNVDGTFQYIGNTTEVSFQHIVLQPEKGWYKVTAVNAAGESAESKAVNAKTPSQ
jgi:penicillin-binding protein